MSSAPDGYDPPAAHPLLAVVDALEDLLDEAGQSNAWSMTPSELQHSLPRLTRVRNRLTEIELRVLAQADRANVGDDVGATNTPAWFAHVTGQRVPAAHGQARLAARLDDHATSREALSSGRINPDQARAVLDAIDALPTDLVGPEIIADAERHLVGLGDLDGDARLDPNALRIAGRRILEVVAPDVADQHEKDALDKD
jgi:hypothetical protein